MPAVRENFWLCRTLQHQEPRLDHTQAWEIITTIDSSRDGLLPWTVFPWWLCVSGASKEQIQDLCQCVLWSWPGMCSHRERRAYLPLHRGKNCGREPEDGGQGHVVTSATRLQSRAKDFVIFIKAHLDSLKDVNFLSQRLKIRCECRDFFPFKNYLAL